MGTLDSELNRNLISANWPSPLSHELHTGLGELTDKIGTVSMKPNSGKDTLQILQTALIICMLVIILWRSQDKVRTGHIELSSNGNAVAVLKTNSEGDAELQLMGKDGRSVHVTAAGITGWTKDGKISFQLLNGTTAGGSPDASPGLTLFDDNGENRAAMYLSEGSPFLIFGSYRDMANKQGREYATQLIMHGTSETASVETFDKSGNVVWTSSKQ